MSAPRVTSWTLRIADGATLPQIFVGNLVEAEGWATLVSGAASYVLMGADGQRSEVECDRPLAPTTQSAPRREA